jgi:hypothetical protein
MPTNDIFDLIEEMEISHQEILEIEATIRQRNLSQK